MIKMKIYYSMIGIDIEIIDKNENKLFNENLNNYLDLNENNEERFDGEWEIENRIIWGFIYGLIKLYNVEKIYDSENDNFENVEEYNKVIKEYLNDDIKNYY